MSGGFGRKERLQSDVEKLLRVIDMFVILMWLDVADSVMGIHICQNLSNYAL